jgi:hypothetical protein
MGKSSLRDVFSPCELLVSMRKTTPFTRNLAITLDLHWICCPELYGSGNMSSVLFAFKDPDGKLLKKLCSTPVFVMGVKAYTSWWKEKAKLRAPASAPALALASVQPPQAAPLAQALPPPPPPIKTWAALALAPPSSLLPPLLLQVAPVAALVPCMPLLGPSLSQVKCNAEASPAGAQRPSKKCKQARAHWKLSERAAKLEECSRA